MEPLSHNIEDYPEGIILPIDKPYRWTSADVIRKVKYAAIRHFGKKNLKVGHAGTLDPLATGILLVCIGPATKRAEELQRSAKQYVAGVTFGATTPSYDLEKEIDAEYPLDGVSRESLERTLPAFVGEQEQIAPLFSAKSVDGVRAYELARKMYREHLRSGASNVSSSSGQHIGDAGSEAEVRDLTIRLLDKDREQLREIDDALERIRKGVYGICEISLDLIPKKRLQVRPFCRLTVKCQEEYEKKYGSYANYRARQSDQVGYANLQNDMENAISLDEDEE